MRDAIGPAAGSGSTPTAAGTSTRPRGCWARWRSSAWSTPSSRARRLAELAAAAPAGRRAAGRRRVDPPGRGPAGGAGGRRRRHRGAQGRSRWAGCAPRCGSPRACGLPVVVSSAVESSVGLAAGVALAAALPELPYDCGLATMSLLTGDVTADPLAERDGELPVRPAAVDARRLAGGRSTRRLAGAAAACRRVPDRHGRLAGAVSWREPVDRVRHGAGRRADPVRAARGRAGARLAQRAAGAGAAPPGPRLGDLRLHVRIDERSASFLALGLAKASRPAGRGGLHVRARPRRISTRR